jgi:Putative Ig domain.
MNMNNFIINYKWLSAIITALLLILTLAPNSLNAQTTTHPSSVAVTMYDFVTFTYSPFAFPSNSTPRWEVSTDGGSSWNTVSGNNYSGITTFTLSIYNTPDSYNGNQYRCIMVNLGITVLTSNVATLTVNSRPADIKRQPDDQYTTEGMGVSFTIDYSNASNVTLQWQVSTNNDNNWDNVSNAGIYSGATTRMLMLSNGVTAAYNGLFYRCVITNKEGVANPVSVTTEPAILYVEPLLTITSHPENRSVQMGEGTTFSVAATGCTGTFSYQWEYLPSVLVDAWSPVTNGGIYSGATTSTLSLSGVTFAQNGYQYRCYVSCSSMPNSPLYSNPATLVVTAGQPPVITTNSLPDGEQGVYYSATLTATSTTTISWDIIVGSLPNGLSLNQVTGEISGTPTMEGSFDFSVAAVNMYGGDRKIFSIVINSSVVPEITLHPDNKNVQEGAGATFSVAATGCTGVFSYQWEYLPNGGVGVEWSPVTNGGIYSGATTPTLSLSSGLTLAQNGDQYRCYIVCSSYPNSPLYSNPATLNITATGVSPVITTASLPDGETGNFYSTTLVATGTTPISWSIISGNLPNGLSLNQTTGVISGTPTVVGSFSFVVSVRNSYGSDDKSFSISINAPIIPEITSHPVDRSVQEGVATTFSVAAIGCNGTFSYRWQYRTNANGSWNSLTNSGIYSGVTTPTLNLSSGVALAHDGYQYRCYISCSSFSNYPLYSNPATLTVTRAGTPPVITTVSLPDGEKGSSYSVTLTATGTAPVSWSIISGNLPDGLSLNPTTGVISGTLTTAGSSRFTVRASNGINPDDTKEFAINVNNPPPPDIIVMTVPNEPFCTVNDRLSIPFTKIDNQHQMKYRVRFDTEAIAAGFRDQTSADDLPADMMFKIDVPKTAPTKSYSGAVLISCEGIEEYNDEYPFTISVVNNGVAIVNQPPVLQSLCGNLNVVLVVDVSGNAKSYQWFNNNQAINGATSRSLSVEEAGTYHLEIMGECGVISSERIVITSPSSDGGTIIRVKWGDFLYVENGSDKYQRFQWYHDGIPINGATSVYFSDNDGFFGEYSVRCFNADGSYDEPCPLLFETRSKTASVDVYPTVLKTNDPLNINIQDAELHQDAIVEIYSTPGVMVYSTKINAPFVTIKPEIMTTGIYFVKIKLPSGKIHNEKIIIQ